MSLMLDHPVLGSTAASEAELQDKTAEAFERVHTINGIDASGVCYSTVKAYIEAVQMLVQDTPLNDTEMKDFEHRLALIARRDSAFMPVSM